MCVVYGYELADSFMSLMTRHWVKGGNRHGVRVLGGVFARRQS